MVKSRKKSNSSSLNLKRRGIKTKKLYNMHGGLNAIQTYGKTEYASSMAAKALREESRLQTQFGDPAIIRGYLQDSRYGTKYGSASYTKIYNALLDLRTQTINALRKINKELSNYDHDNPDAAAIKALPLVKQLYKETTEERFQLIRVQEHELKTQFKTTKYQNDLKKDDMHNELSSSIHELRESVLHALYDLVYNENNQVYITLGSVVKQGVNKFDSDGPGRTFQ
jgi:hypothetical protein